MSPEMIQTANYLKEKLAPSFRWYDNYKPPERLYYIPVPWGLVAYFGVQIVKEVQEISDDVHYTAPVPESKQVLAVLSPGHTAQDLAEMKTLIRYVATLLAGDSKAAAFMESSNESKYADHKAILEAGVVTGVPIQFIVKWSV